MFFPNNYDIFLLNVCFTYFFLLQVKSKVAEKATQDHTKHKLSEQEPEDEVEEEDEDEYEDDVEDEDEEVEEDDDNDFMEPALKVHASFFFLFSSTSCFFFLCMTCTSC